MGLLDSATSRVIGRSPFYQTPVRSIYRLLFWLRGISGRREIASAREPFDSAAAVEVECENCQARFVAWYAADDTDPKLLHVKRCGLCGGDPTTRGLYKDCALRLVAMVPPRS
jgi:hypothetical protein